jgi:3'-phosphoadenosine 5'-phosphosulfate sulfotransferase (PAPS reductase)/FAD synthetase
MNYTQLDLNGNPQRTPDEILATACAERHPEVITAAFSGGDDSLAALHIAARFAREHGYRFEVLHLDTGIGIPETQEYVVRHCQEHGFPLYIYRAAENKKADGTPDPKIYEEAVLYRWRGFPGFGIHSKTYQDLKQRSFDRYKRERWEGRQALYATGMRRAESVRRRNRPEYEVRGRTTWACPVIHWMHADLLAYFEQYDIERNPVARLLGHSGECECGAGGGGAARLEQIRQHYPDFAARIDALADECARRGLCATWGGCKKQLRVASEQMDMFAFCSDCADQAVEDIEHNPLLMIGVEETPHREVYP